MIPGIGYAIAGSDATLDDETLHDPEINAVEIDLESPSDRFPFPRNSLGTDCEVVSVRAIELDVTAELSPRPEYLDALKAISLENGARSVSGRLRFTRLEQAPAATRARGSLLGAAALSRTCRNVRFVQSHLGQLRFYLEDADCRGPAETAPEAKFLSRLLAKTGCGWTLDVTRLYVAALNSGQSAHDIIEEVIPAASRVQIHITGVRHDETLDRFVESPSHPIPEALLELYAFVLEVAFDKVDAVFVRRSHNAMNRAEVRNEMRAVREIAEGIGAIA